MADILEGKRNFRVPALGAEEIVVVIFQLSVRKMVPSNEDYSTEKSNAPISMADLRAGISVQQCRCFDDLSPVFASLTLECIVSVTDCFLIEEEQLPKGIDGKVPLRIFFFVYDG